MTSIKEEVLGSIAPLPIKLLAAYWALTGLLSLAGAAVVLTALATQSFSITGLIILLVQIPLLLIAALALATSYRLLQLKRFGLRAALALAILGLGVAAFALPDPANQSNPWAWGQIVIWMASPVYLIRHRTLFQ